jgi:hypothetical protein
MRYYEISKVMSSLYFVHAVSCLFVATVPEFDTQRLPLASCGLYSVNSTLNSASYSGTSDSKWQNTSSPEYNDEISLLI